MTSDPDLTDLVRRLRDQDPEAIAELVRRYEPDIRRIARVRLARFGLRHLVDSVDIAQSVFGRFLSRLQTGGLEFESTDKLLRLLTVIAVNRVTSHARRERLRVRPVGQGGDDQPGLIDTAPDPQPGAGRVVAAREQLDWLFRSLGQDERALLTGRLAGKEWAELAADRGVGADALRKRLSRALDEIGGRLGLTPPDA